ncbi:hypothetical protein [Mesoplasma melaleucae]|uniref:Uncharacterized protein n=1 Tax=Mesoplasma melaleucae TaxID=81459 RepID=A0A2K8NX40_9MOLU|nr:hypothetical protein [Mesoplasma melaleucae]ATZ18106.1 hypothetical protein EMELA_v1c05790 [Mesoplasma melaleucae]
MRILSIICLMFSAFLINMIISMLFFVGFKLTNPNDLLVYRLYISAYGLYAIWILIVMVIGMIV